MVHFGRCVCLCVFGGGGLSEFIQGSNLSGAFLSKSATLPGKQISEPIWVYLAVNQTCKLECFKLRDRIFYLDLHTPRVSGKLQTLVSFLESPFTNFEVRFGNCITLYLLHAKSDFFIISGFSLLCASMFIAHYILRQSKTTQVTFDRGLHYFVSGLS